jgi:hypothetical protein
MRPHPLFVALIILGSAQACKFIRKDNDREPVARVMDKYLYADEIAGLANGMSPEDSASFIQNYIYNWGKEQLLISRAEYNLRDDQKDFEELVNQYRNDLIKFAYLEKYVSQNLDTAITENEIKSYFTENGRDFELKENIVRCDYYIFRGNTPDITKAKNWWRISGEKNDERFSEYASVFAIAKSVGDTNWISFDKLAMEISPLPTYNQAQLLSQNKRLLLEDTAKVYFLEFKGYKIVDDVSPLPYVQSTIKSIILNKRKLNLIAKMEERLVEDAFNKSEFEIF